jgi:hypothetical protein
MTSGFNTRPCAAEPTAGIGPLPLMLRIAAILALGAVLGAAPAHADQAADTLKRLNLLGRWANDCADPTRTGISYEIDAEGSAFFVNVVGSHRILSATSSDGREVVLTIKFLRPTEERMMMAPIAHRSVVMSNTRNRWLPDLTLRPHRSAKPRAAFAETTLSPHLPRPPGGMPGLAPSRPLAAWDFPRCGAIATWRRQCAAQLQQRWENGLTKPFSGSDDKLRKQCAVQRGAIVRVASWIFL